MSNFEVQKKALEVKNDADFVCVFSRLSKRLLCFCAPRRLESSYRARQRSAVGSPFAYRKSVHRM